MLIKISQVKIVDGSGTPVYIGDIAVRNQKILAVGTVPALNYERVIDGTGLIATPGFIDTHSHSDLMVLAKPEVLPKIFQGITTDVLGQDGVSMAPLPLKYIPQWKINIAGLDGTSDEVDWTYQTTEGYLKEIEETKTTINTAYLVPHGNIRMEAMGLEDAEPTEKQLQKMKQIVRREMEAGAAGISSGLIYIPCAYSKTEELIELCRVAAEYDGVFVVHQRSEADDIIASAKEIIEIGRQSGIRIHFSHFKVAGKNNWDKIDTMLGLIDDAEKEGIQISFDQYPYVAGSTTLGVVVPPWAHGGGTDHLLERLANTDMREKMKYDMEHGIPGWDNFIDFAGFDNIYITDVLTDKNRAAIGKSLAEYAQMQGKDVFDATFDLLLEEKNSVSMIDFYGTEEHVKTFICRKEMNLCTDGMIANDKPHPRAYGAFARLIDKYVRQEQVLSLEEAVYKMTHKAATALGIRQRGLLKENYYADMNLIDYENFREKGTFTDPAQHPTGLKLVMINGEIVIENGIYQENYPGKVIRRDSSFSKLVKWTENRMPVDETLVITDYLNEEKAQEALEFHVSLPEYKKTPLYELDDLAKKLGLGKIFIKDESVRFGLNAFKGLGAGYAMARYLEKHPGEITFYSATDGNHGMAVAWFAQKLGQKTSIYLPKGSSAARLNRILATGARAEITDLNYDDTVRYACKEAERCGGVMIQDTAWEGYEEIPVWIMQGYSAIAREIMQDIKELPTHIFLQAGVGSFASAVTGYFAAVYGEKAPRILIFESNEADCYYQSAMAEDGHAVYVKGEMKTLMAGLACGEPNTISFKILKNHTDCFTSCDDYAAALGMRILGNPLGTDNRIISGESGAGTTGLLYLIMTQPLYADLRKTLDLTETSRVLLISTEGDTDPERYREIVWNGKDCL